MDPKPGTKEATVLIKTTLDKTLAHQEAKNLSRDGYVYTLDVIQGTYEVRRGYFFGSINQYHNGQSLTSASDLAYYASRTYRRDFM